MCPLTIHIYTRIVNYFVHLLELAGKRSTVIQSGIADCMTIVNSNQMYWLTIVLYLFKIARINLKPGAKQLDMFKKHGTITAIRNTLREKFEDKFFSMIRNLSK